MGPEAEREIPLWLILVGGFVLAAAVYAAAAFVAAWAWGEGKWVWVATVTCMGTLVLLGPWILLLRWILDVEPRRRRK